MPLILCLDLNHVNPGHNKKKIIYTARSYNGVWLRGIPKRLKQGVFHDANSREVKTI